MADFPALPLWTDSYLADTLDLSVEEHGTYLLLLMIAWRSPGCRLPDDDVRLARMLKISPRVWKRLRKSVLERFFTKVDGGFEQKRLTRERKFCDKRRENLSRAGRHGGRAKSLKSLDSDLALPEAKGKRLESTHTHRGVNTPTPPTPPQFAEPPQGGGEKKSVKEERIHDPLDQPKGPHPGPDPIDDAAGVAIDHAAAAYAEQQHRTQTIDWHPEFEKFMAEFPKLPVGRLPRSKSAKTAFELAVLAGADPTEIVAGASAYAASFRSRPSDDRKFVTSHEKFIREEIWRDVLDNSPAFGLPKIDDATLEHWDRTPLEKFWHWKTLPLPAGQTERASDEKLAEYAGLDAVPGPETRPKTAEN